MITITFKSEDEAWNTVNALYCAARRYDECSEAFPTHLDLVTQLERQATDARATAERIMEQL